jgi:general secretion pathway protein J
MRVPQCRSTPNDAGFSLVELLISLTILALLLAMMPSTLRLGKRAWETTGALEETPAAAALSFAAQSLKSALPVFQRDSSGLPHIAFDGTEQTISFVADLASGPSGGGLYRIDAGAPIASTDGPAVRLSLYGPDTTAQATGIEVRDLADSYSELRFRYFGSPAPGAPNQWQSSWHRSDRLPDLVDVVATPRTPAAANAQYRTELKMRPVL